MIHLLIYMSCNIIYDRHMTYIIWHIIYDMWYILYIHNIQYNIWHIYIIYNINMTYMSYNIDYVVTKMLTECILLNFMNWMKIFEVKNVLGIMSWNTSFYRLGNWVTVNLVTWPRCSLAANLKLEHNFSDSIN